ncbi:RES domain-containing protein [bacterium]|nr:MAG: RES domain-containing protein [bacterium]
MPEQLPPALASVATTTLAPGSTLWRIHADRWKSTQFNPTVRTGASDFDALTDNGGRFDATDADRFAYLYAAEDTIGAVAEALLRDRTSPPPYILRRAKLEGLVLAKLETLKPLKVALLHGRGLTAIGQDAWLSGCGPRSYGITREWARAVRAWSPEAVGLVWRSRLDNDRRVYILFEDRCPPASLGVVARHSAASGAGLILVRRALAEHGVVLS